MTPKSLSLLILLTAASLPLCFALPTDSRINEIASYVTMYRDSYGVPHVYGATDASVVFGFVYAQAEDNFPQIEENYIRVLGRAGHSRN